MVENEIITTSNSIKMQVIDNHWVIYFYKEMYLEQEKNYQTYQLSKKKILGVSCFLN